jgi:hypothetical protein
VVGPWIMMTMMRRRRRRRRRGMRMMVVVRCEGTGEGASLSTHVRVRRP